MFRKLIFTSFTLFVLMVVTTVVCFAFTLLTKEKAFKKYSGHALGLKPKPLSCPETP